MGSQIRGRYYCTVLTMKPGRLCYVACFAIHEVVYTHAWVGSAQGSLGYHAFSKQVKR